MTVLRKRGYVKGKKPFSVLHVTRSSGDATATWAKSQSEKNNHFQERLDWRASILLIPSLHLQPSRSKVRNPPDLPATKFNSYCVSTSGSLMWPQTREKFPFSWRLHAISIWDSHRRYQCLQARDRYCCPCTATPPANKVSLKKSNSLVYLKLLYL